MKTVDRPLKIMAEMMVFLLAGGKFLVRFAGDQSSKRREAARRMGMVRRLL
jgi:hypothetical protein